MTFSVSIYIIMYCLCNFVSFRSQTLINQTLTSNVLIQLGLLSLFEETGVTLFHKLTVKQVLFGYNDTLLLFLKNVEENKLVQDLLKLLEMFDPALAAKIPLINPLIQLQVSLYW